MKLISPKIYKLNDFGGQKVLNRTQRAIYWFLILNVYIQKQMMLYGILPILMMESCVNINNKIQYNSIKTLFYEEYKYFSNKFLN